MVTADLPPSPPIPWRWTLCAGRRLGSMLWVMLRGVAGYLAMGRAERASVTGRARWLQRTCAHALRVLAVEIEERGERPDGVMLAPNHVSYLDILVLATLTPTVFVAKAEVSRWPAYGWFARKAGTLFLRRESRSDLVRVGAALSPVMAAGVNLAVFLEGTSTDGRGVLRFRPSLLAPAVANGWPVMPVALRYVVPDGHDSAVEVAWWGTMPLAPHLVTMMGIPRIKAVVAWGRARPAGDDRKALATALQADVAAHVERGDTDAAR